MINWPLDLRTKIIIMNDSRIDDISRSENTFLILLLTCTATMGGFLFGFDSGVINGTVDGLQQAFNSDSVGTGFNVASMLIGCAAGAFFAGNLADIYGRRSMLLVASVLFIISAWGSGAADTSLEFVVYRVIGGLAVGAASVMAPAYISEIAPSRLRGRLSSIQQVAIIAGLFGAFLSNYFLAQSAGSSITELAFGYEAWRWMFWVELIPAVLFFVALLFIPESPRYLVMRQRLDEAESVLARLYSAAYASAKCKEVHNSLAADHHAPKFTDVLVRGINVFKPIVWVGIGLAVFQQLVGINVIFYYGAVLWQSVGFSESDALLVNVISGALSIGAVIFALFLIDRVGRKPLLFIGSLGMACSLIAVAIAFSTGAVGEGGAIALSDNAGLTALVSANLYVICFNFSWGPVMWVMLGEMFPNQIRGASLAVAGLFQWLANFAVTMTFPIILGSIGLAAAYGIYAFCAVISAIFVYFYIVETKGKELEAM